MAALASNQVLIESMMNNLDWIDFGHRNKDVISYYYDDYLLERVRVETWCRKNKQYIEKVFEGVVDFSGGDNLITEQEGFAKTLLTDLGLGIATSAAGVAKLSSAVPGLGQAVAAGGMLYYIARAIRSHSRGQKLASYFEIFSAVMASAGFIPGVGSVLSAIGNTIMAPFKWFFSTVWGGAKSILGRFVTTAAEEGVEAAAPVVSELAEGIAGTPGAEVAAAATGKVEGVLAKIINWWRTPAGEKVAAEIGAENVTIVKKMFEKIKSFLRLFSRVTETVAESSGDEVGESLLRVMTTDLAEDVAVVGAATGERELTEALAEATAKEAAKRAELEAAEGAVSAASTQVAKAEADVTRVAAEEAASRMAPEAAEAAIKGELDNIVSGVSAAADEATNISTRVLEGSLDEIGTALGGLGDDALESAAPAVESAFKKGGAEAFEANLNKMLNPNTGNLSQEAFESFLTNAEKFVVQNMDGGAAALDAGGDVIKLFSQTFCGETGPVLSKIVFEGAETGARSASGGMKFIFSAAEGTASVPFTLVQMTEFFGSQGAARIMTETFTSPSALPTFERLAAEASEQLAESLVAKASAQTALADASAIVANLERQIAALPRPPVTPETVGSAIRTGVREFTESTATNSKGLWKMICEAWTRDYTKAYAISMKPMLASMGAQTATIQMDSTSGEKIDMDAGTIEDRRLTKSQKAALKAQQDGDIDDGTFATVRTGIRENLELDSLIWTTKRNTRLIRSQKLISLIN